MSKKIATVTLSLALGLLPASCVLAADSAAAPAGDKKPTAEAHADAKGVHKDPHATKGDVKAAQKRQPRWTNRRHMKHDMAEHAEDATDAKDAKESAEGSEQAAGDEQKSGQ